jgi:hypothetical protein
MRSRFSVAAVQAVALAALACPALAQQGGADALVSTANEWGGQGGAYTCQQWRAYVTRMYRIGDPHHRGYIDAKDFENIKSASPVFAQASFDFFDQSGKGRVTQKEFIEAESPFFALFDKKKACRVTQEDIRQASGPKPATPQERNSGRGPGAFGWRN